MLRWWAKRHLETIRRRFNGHPPLGVNATGVTGYGTDASFLEILKFQWAPTLGGECYLRDVGDDVEAIASVVSMGTHPWG